MIKRVLSFVLMILLLITSIPLNVFSAETSTENTNDTVISVNQGYGKAETVVKVDIFVDNNPGFVSLALRLYFDSSILTLLAVENGSALANMNFVPPIDDALTSGCVLSWDAEKVDEELVVDGVVATLTFQINKGVEANSISEVSVQRIDAKDNDLRDLFFSTLSGKVQVLTYTPGDVNDDGIISATDNVYIRRFNAGGYGVVINEAAADVNGDGMITSTDVVYIRRYMAGGYFDPDTGKPLMLKPSTPKCAHNMTATAAKAATCTEDGNIAYWYCELCRKYFRDENGNVEIELEDTVIEASGHTEVTIPAVAPTYEAEGSTAGVKCSVCDEVLVEPETIPPLEPNEVSITYKYDTIAGDTYLQTVAAKALADGKIVSHQTADVTTSAYTNLPFIENETIVGYEFQGWYESTSADAEKVTSIAKGTSGNVTLYAKWVKTTYTVTFKAPLKSVASITRTIDQTTLLPEDKEMEVPNYYFMGWSDGTGAIIDQISPGVENVTVYANWTSATRNVAYAANYNSQTPIIIEDDHQYLFVCNIGYIDRVPVEIIGDSIYNSGTYKYIVESFESATIGESKEKEVNSTIANATTHSSSWTLSEEWNELITEVNGKEESMEQGKVVAISDGSSKAYSSSASSYSGNSFHASNDSLVTAKTVTDDSTKVSASVDASIGYGPAKVSAGISGEQAHSVHQEDYAESKSSLEVSAEWNQSSSYTASGESFINTTNTNSILEAAKNTWNLEISKAIKDSQARTDEESSSTTSTDGYKSLIAFHNEKTSGNSTTIERTFTEVGYYRYALFAKVHVFAAVGYDMETGAYFVNTYSVVDDTMTYDFDYSSDGSYKDYDNAVLPFEVPIFVYDYIFESNAKTEGVAISRDGVVREYTGDATNVRIPDYATFDNGDGTYVVVPVVGIKEGLFSGKTGIETVKLGKFISFIPDNAFNGCTALENVEYNAAILESIGNYAFDGCTSLNEIKIGDATQCKVTSLGVDAFKNVPNAAIYVANAEMVENAVSSGANNLSVYMKHLTASEISELIGKALIVAETTSTSFAIYGADKTFSDLSIESNAASTLINGISFANNTSVPMKLNSAVVELNRANVVDSKGISMQLLADSTNITIKSVNSISTAGNIAILSKGLTINRASGEYPALSVTGGDVVVCGEIEQLKQFDYLSISGGVIRSISSTEYENLLDTHYINFNANGGTVGVESVEVMYNSPIGTLPVPAWANHTFLGWFKEDETQLTDNAVFNELSDITVKAHWMTDWVLESEVPAGATLADGKAKWTYDKIEYKESANATESGWTKYDQRWGEYGAWSEWSTTEAIESDSRDVEINTVIDKEGYNEYLYTRYINNAAFTDSNGQWHAAFSIYHYCQTCAKNYYGTSASIWVIDDILSWSTTRRSVVSEWACGCGTMGSKYESNGDGSWYFEEIRYVDPVTHNEYRYRDRSLIYCHSRTVAMESATQVVASDTIVNVKKFVKYIVD